jgi:hypothetical protein
MEKVIFAASNHVHLRLFIIRFRACLSYCCGTFEYNRVGTLQEVAKVGQVFTTGLVPKRKSESSLTRTTQPVNKTLSPWLICPDVKSCDLAVAF